jgi:gamma-glutamylaminecyclotransferase
MKLFVYGTILSGMRNHRRVNGCKFIGRGKSLEKMYMTSLKSSSYPMITYDMIHTSQIPNHIKGEVYEIDEEALQDLDYLEGHPYFYTRQVIDIELENGEILKTFAYIVLQPDILNEVSVNYEVRSAPINDGDFKRFFSK